MLQTMDDQWYAFIENILNAGSQEEVRELIQMAIKEYENIDSRNRFVDEVMKALNGLNAMDHDFHQWSNIKMARIQMYQAKRDAALVS
ncbi:MAG: hypothetical protein J7578_03830 [Chitinophagaceae bacterium]|nr:hypothetical protein [Chitinophagaceae bacterium]